MQKWGTTARIQNTATVNKAMLLCEDCESDKSQIKHRKSKTACAYVAVPGNYSVMYFNCITAFKVLYFLMFVKGRTHAHYVVMSVCPNRRSEIECFDCSDAIENTQWID